MSTPVTHIAPENIETGRERELTQQQSELLSLVLLSTKSIKIYQYLIYLQQEYGNQKATARINELTAQLEEKTAELEGIQPGVSQSDGGGGGGVGGTPEDLETLQGELDGCRDSLQQSTALIDTLHYENERLQAKVELVSNDAAEKATLHIDQFYKTNFGGDENVAGAASKLCKNLWKIINGELPFSFEITAFQHFSEVVEELVEFGNNIEQLLLSKIFPQGYKEENMPPFSDYYDIIGVAFSGLHVSDKETIQAFLRRGSSGDGDIVLKGNQEEMQQLTAAHDAEMQKLTTARDKAIKDLTTATTTHTSELRKNESIINDLKTQLGICKTKLDECVTQFADLNTTNGQLMAKQRNLMEENVTYQEQNRSLSEQLTERDKYYESEIGKFRNLNGELTKQADAIRAEMEELRLQLADTESRSTEERARLVADRAILEQELRQAREAISAKPDRYDRGPPRPSKLSQTLEAKRRSSRSPFRARVDAPLQEETSHRRGGVTGRPRGGATGRPRGRKTSPRSLSTAGHTDDAPQTQTAFKKRDEASYVQRASRSPSRSAAGSAFKPSRKPSYAEQSRAKRAEGKRMAEAKASTSPQ